MFWIDFDGRVKPFMVLATAALAACSSATTDPAPTGETTGTAREAVIAGVDSDASQDAVVFLVHKDPTNPRVGMCTGSLIAPNLVLTARHCVADADESAACAADGSPGTGGAIRGNYPPATLLVYTGKNRPPFASQKDPVPAGLGAQIVDDGAKNLCNHDLALIVLNEPIPNMPIVSMRLDGAVEKGETFTAVGWGITTATTKPLLRQQRAGVTIVAVGPDPTADLPVPPNLFAAGEAICLGDSGGPALASTGAILGVVTGGGNGQPSTASDPAASCVGHAASSLYTRLAPFKELITRGFELAGAEPWVEGGPDPRLPKPASACGDTDRGECPTSPGAAPASATSSESAGSAGSAGSGGCSAAPMAPSSGGSLALAIAALVVARGRIRASRGRRS